MQPVSEAMAVLQARFLDVHTIRKIDSLHQRWLLDSEIAERLGLEPLVIWHARQIHEIDRHKPRRVFRTVRHRYRRVISGPSHRA